jgi:precorrin-6A/cobalt-precorrin-6A reductase
MPAKILVLGGTRDARDLAALLVRENFDVTTSLAGVTRDPVLPPGKTKIGGFGGEQGLLAYLKHERFAAVIDATHPFAAQMSRHGHAAAALEGLPYLRLERPPYRRAEADLWTDVASLEQAAQTLPGGAHVLVTTGRKGLEAFMDRDDLSGIIRTIEQPLCPLRTGWTLIRERPPFMLADELALLHENSVTHLITKNSGGTETEAKLIAARQLRLPVVMISRPSKPGDKIYATAEEVCSALIQRFGLDPR